MRYAVVMSKRAREDLSRFPYELAEFLVDQIMLLSDDPLARGYKARYPLPRGQIMNCERVYSGVEYTFTLRFDFEPGETHIRIAAIVCEPPFSQESV